jgi:hypothetical protein
VSDRKFDLNTFFERWKRVDSESDLEEESESPALQAEKECVDTLRLIIQWGLQDYRKGHIFGSNTLTLEYSLRGCHDPEAMLNLLGGFLITNSNDSTHHPLVACLARQFYLCSTTRSDILFIVTRLIRKQAEKNKQPEWINFEFKFNLHGKALITELENLTHILKMFNTVAMQEEGDYLLLTV